MDGKREGEKLTLRRKERKGWYSLEKRKSGNQIGRAARVEGRDVGTLIPSLISADGFGTATEMGVGDRCGKSGNRESGKAETESARGGAEGAEAGGKRKANESSDEGREARAKAG
jgi:hypothetical protein